MPCFFVLIITLFKGYKNISYNVLLTLFSLKMLFEHLFLNILQILKWPVFFLWLEYYLKFPKKFLTMFY